MARELISKNATKSVYRDGDKAIKSFCKGFPKAEVLNEAPVSKRLAESTSRLLWQFLLMKMAVGPSQRILSVVRLFSS